METVNSSYFFSGFSSSSISLVFSFFSLFFINLADSVNSWNERAGGNSAVVCTAVFSIHLCVCVSLSLSLVLRLGKIQFFTSFDDTFNDRRQWDWTIVLEWPSVAGHTSVFRWTQVFYMIWWWWVHKSHRVNEMASESWISRLAGREEEAGEEAWFLFENEGSTVLHLIPAAATGRPVTLDPCYFKYVNRWW